MRRHQARPSSFRPHSRLPSLRLHRPSGRAVVTFKGVDYYCGAYGSPEATSVYTRLCREYLDRGYLPPRRPSGFGPGDFNAGPLLSVNELLLGFLADAERKYLPPSRELELFKPLIKKLRRRYGDTPAIHFGPAALTAFRRELEESGNSLGTINKKISAICRIWKWAVEKELLPSGNHDALTKVAPLRIGHTTAKQPREVTAVPESVFFATIQHLSGPVAAILWLCFYTGARLSDILTLTTEAIDRSSDCWEYRRKQHKTAIHRKKRVIFFGPKSQEILRPFLRPEAPAEFLFSPARAEAERRDRLKRPNRTDRQRAKAAQTKRRQASLVRKEETGTARVKNSRRPGTNYTRHSIYNAVKRILKRHGIPHWHPHQLRHTRSEILKKEESEAIATIVSRDVPTNFMAKTVLGHDSQTVTARYGDESQAVRIAVARKHG